MAPPRRNRPSEEKEKSEENPYLTPRALLDPEWLHGQISRDEAMDLLQVCALVVCFLGLDLDVFVDCCSFRSILTRLHLEIRTRQEAAVLLARSSSAARARATTLPSPS
jgi:hypothetical protein